jgi:arabinofuranosyltransferase
MRPEPVIARPAAPSRAPLYVGATVVVVAMLVYRAAMGSGGLATDDTYIHLRIARNWAAGAGPVFNAGERVEASSSPAWLALLTIGFRLGIPALALLTALEVLCAAWTGAATAWLAERCAGRSAAWIAPVLVGVLPSFGVWIGTGMETIMAAAVLATALAMALEARTPRGALGAGLLGALLVLVRQEAIVVVPVLGWLATRRTDPKERALSVGMFVFGSAGPLAALLLARHAYFNAWVPNTYVAKVAGETVADRLLGVVYVAKFVAIQIGLFALAAYALVRPSERLRQVAVVLLVYLAAVMWTGGDHFYYSRLAVPTLPLLATLAAAGVVGMQGRWRMAAVAAIAVQIPWALFGTRNLAYAKVALTHTEYSAAIGASLAPLPEGTVATISIGGIGYASGRPILDLVGLADPVIARSPRIPGAKRGHNHGNVEYVLGRRPAFVIPIVWLSDNAVDDDEESRQLTSNHESLAAAAQLVQDPRFRDQYRPFDWQVGSLGHVRIWARRDVLTPVANEKL